MHLDEKITVKNIRPWNRLYPEIKSLQEKAFPKQEQYPMWILLLLSLRKNTHYLSFSSGEKVYGLMFFTETRNSVYLLYIAVNERYRNVGLGGRMLSYLRAKTKGKCIYLNIDPVQPEDREDSICRRRMKFYFRNGYCDTRYRMKDITGKYQILSSDENFSLKDYMQVINRIGMWLFRPRVYPDRFCARR